MSEQDQEAKPQAPAPAPAPPTAAERAWAVRRARVRRIVRQFALLVGVPTFCAVLYYGLWASPEYVSVTVVTVQSPPAGQDELGGSFVANRDDDVRLVREALASRATLARLIEQYKWREHYTENGNRFSKLDADAGSEEAYAYYSERLELKSGKGQAIRVSVRAFSSEAASALSRALLEIAEARLNEVTLRPLFEQEKVARQRLEKARKTLAELPASASADPDQVEDPARLRAREGVAKAEALLDKLMIAKVARKRYLTVVSGPSEPNEAAYPRRLWSIATVFVVALSLMGVFGLLLGAVREHAKV